MKSMVVSKRKKDFYKEYIQQLILSIELCKCCNLSCVMCPYHDGKPQHSGFMSKQTFMNTVNSIKQIDFPNLVVIPYLFGESTMHPQICEFITILDQALDPQKNQSICLSTNAINLNEEVSHTICNSKTFKKLTISIDAASSKTYDTIKGSPLYSKVVNNVINFLKIRKQTRNNFPRIYIQFIIMEENKYEVELFITTWRKVFEQLGLKMFNVSGDFWELERDSDMLFLIYRWDPDSRENSWKNNCLHKDIITNIGIITKEQKQFYLAREYLYLFQEKEFCMAPFYMQTVHFDGNISPCCNDDYNCLYMGNVNENELNEIFHSKRYETLRMFHLYGDLKDYPHCHNCIFYYNEKMVNPHFYRDLFRKKYL